jgi:hypothetical protein
MTQPVIIGRATLYLGDCRDILPTLGKVDHVITDPPYSERTHRGHDVGGGNDGANRAGLGYAALRPEDVPSLADAFCRICAGWIVWMTDYRLAIPIEAALKSHGRYVFSPVPYHHPGRSVRLTGDGPSSWTDWLMVSRTPAQMKWGTLRGGYVANEGWNDRERMGGKPTRLMRLVVSDYSRRDELVCDPFMGAGTTGLACALEGRRFVGVEIDPCAFDIACKRIEEAQRQGDMFVEAA